MREGRRRIGGMITFGSRIELVGRILVGIGFRRVLDSSTIP